NTASSCLTSSSVQVLSASSRIRARNFRKLAPPSYFAFINHAQANYKGGASFRKFLARIREDALKTCTDEEVKQLDAVLKGEATVAAVKETKPRQFVRNWAMSDLLSEIGEATHGRNFAQGKAVF